MRFREQEFYENLSTPQTVNKNMQIISPQLRFQATLYIKILACFDKKLLVSINHNDGHSRRYTSPFSAELLALSNYLIHSFSLPFDFNPNVPEGFLDKFTYTVSFIGCQHIIARPVQKKLQLKVKLSDTK